MDRSDSVNKFDTDMSDISNLIKTKFSDTINKYKMLFGAKSVLAGFSGGADSTALLCLLKIYCEKNEISLFAVHINHQIRGAEAERDEKHCMDFCREYKIPLFSERVDIPLLSRTEGIGVEEMARRERYRIFSALCAKHHIDRVALAHHAGDNLETVLFHLIRGTGIKGLCGIPPVRDNIIRPLLDCSRKEIEEYLRGSGIPYIIDSTNADIGYTRNFIRHEIIPLIERVNGAAEENVLRMCAQLRRDSDFLDELALNHCLLETEIALSDSILSRKILHEYEQYTKNTSGILGKLEYVHIQAILDLIRHGKLWQSVSLPNSVKLTLDRNGYHFSPDIQTSAAEYDFAVQFGKNMLPSGCGTLFLYDKLKDIKEIKNIYKLFIHKAVYSDKIKGIVRVRNRREGDKIFLHGVHKSLRKLYGDRKIPPARRSCLPIIYDSDGILWIPGAAVRDGASPEELCGDNMTYLVYIPPCPL